MGLFFERFKYELLAINHRISVTLSHSHDLLAEEVKDNGYAVIPEFFAGDSLSNLVGTMKCHFAEPRAEFSYKGDTRHYAIENARPEVACFSNNKDLINIGNRVMSRPLIKLFTLGNHLVSGSQGTSGGGWHRDSTQPQFKAMVYLTDVSEVSGPLEIIPKSHKFLAQYKLSKKGLLAYNQQWLSEDEVVAIEDEHERRVTVTGVAGTLVLFESSTLHRGRPIEQGERLALTNYYYPVNSNHDKLLKNFGVT